MPCSTRAGAPRAALAAAAAVLIGLTVRWVNPATPAAEAGLQIGDVVTEVDGEIALAIDPGTLRLRLQQEGRVVSLRLRRGADTLTVQPALRRLI